MLIHMSPKERLGYACVVGLVLFAFGFIGARHLRQPAPIVFQNPNTASNQAAQHISEPSSNIGSTVVVHVAGAVKQPGIVRLASGARAVDAVHAAGGPTRNADLDSINLAAKLVDGSQLRIPTKAMTVATASPTAPHPSTDTPKKTRDIDTSGSFLPVTIEPTYLAATVTPLQLNRQTRPPANGWSRKTVAEVNVNVASAQELQSLPGVGPATAEKIIAFRQEHGPFRSPDELLDVPGIGPKKLDKMRAFIRL